MRKRIVVKVTAAFALVTLLTAMTPSFSNYLSVGSDAPAFEITATDGESYSLEAVIEKAPAFIVFWKGRCPSNTVAAPLFNALKKTYSDNVTFLGVVWTPSERAQSWVDQFNVNYPILADSDGSLVNDYELVYSICTFKIGTDGKIADVYEGFGYDEMNRLNKAMAEVAGAEVADVDLSSAPTRKKWG